MRRMLFLLPVLSTLLCPLAAQAESYLVVSTCGALPRTPSLGSADGPIGINQGGQLCVQANVNVQASIATPLLVTFVTPVAVNIPLPAQVVSGAYSDGALFTLGAVADAIYGGSGSATVDSILKGIYQAIKTITVTTTPIATPLAVTVVNTPLNVTFATPIAVTQSTSPWVVTGTALQGTTPWVTSIPTPVVVSPNNITPVSQSTVPWVVSPNNITPVSQSTNPWAVSQSTSPWLTQDNAANVRRVVPNTASQFALVATGSTPIATANQIGGVVSSTESPKYSPNTIGGFFLDLVGKLITSPYANRENMVRGSKSLIATANASILPAPTGGLKNYVTDLACMRSDAGTSAIVVSTNDVTDIGSSSTFVLPNTGGGGGFMKSFQVPLVVAANTAFLVASLTSTTGVQCSAEGFTGY